MWILAKYLIALYSALDENLENCVGKGSQSCPWGLEMKASFKTDSSYSFKGAILFLARQ